MGAYKRAVEWLSKISKKRVLIEEPDDKIKLVGYCNGIYFYRFPSRKDGKP